MRGRICLIALVAVLIGFASFPAAAQSARTFYIDYAGGSNSNNGLSKNSAWKTHPYMQSGSGCTGTGKAPAYSHQTGDRFIFMGGDTWPAACFGMDVTAGGSSSAWDYYGVDKAWYSGSSWAMPAFNLNGSKPTAVSGFPRVISFEASYLTFDSLLIENEGSTAGWPNSSCGDSAYGTTTNVGHILIENGTIQNWSTTTTGINAGFGDGSGGICQYGSSVGDMSVDNMTITNQGGQPLPWGGCVYNFTLMENSTCEYVSEGYLGGGVIHDNKFAYLSDAATVSPYSNAIHTNTIENTWNTSGAAVYNNYFLQNKTAVILYLCSGDRVYNNVFDGNSSGTRNSGAYDIDWGVCPGDTGSTVGYVANNTDDCSGRGCFMTDSKGSQPGALYMQNNIWIGNSSPVWIRDSIGNLQNTHNYVMASSEASTNGFTSATMYAPTSTDSNVSGAGANLTSACQANLVALCSDTSGAPWYGSNYVGRPTGSTGWTLGAFAGTGGSVTQVAPPTDLTAAVQ